ncbi:MAG TPA: hypothetical protein VF768_05365 [Holophagaceae bacterium]
MEEDLAGLPPDNALNWLEEEYIAENLCEVCGAPDAFDFMPDWGDGRHLCVACATEASEAQRAAKG